ncbi:glycosyl hydrolase family 76 protein [Magnaporthiopsis poae ATCC 64411]|uniref:mannan endo-1,6-alpha-mannosidase n=1 Tax=Magnaporthiopsis poae (strain ATCC 64411 / 73-15) TaxID=644358 RepID=A0A0C4DQR6_MAGP6|nr:glycosyl hydrolase family 76 protein [Magnaporthiopsis poae ATCC 64411]
MWGGRRVCSCLAAASLLGLAGAYKLDPNSTDSIKQVSRSITDDLINTFYTGHLPGNTPGILPSPYYWWEGGALMGALIDYWYYTGDTKFNDLTSQALLAQVGEFNDYMPKAQIMNEGNDDQGFWGVAVMAAAEYKFPDPPKDKPQWLALAQAVFNTQASRWDNQHCGGGLRWQIFQWNNGYDYKNTISQACFFNIAARLALYTGNNTYAEWAEKVWDWTYAVGFIDKQKYWIYDGAHIPANCTNIVPYVWTYNSGAFMHGVAAMYNFTTGARREIWRDRLDRLVDASSVFYNGTNNEIMSEVACEPVGLCNVDQQSFKAYLARWMAATTKWAPWTERKLMPRLRTTAVMAASLCTGGSNGRMCGHKWYEGTHDGLIGLGQQMSVMEVVVGLMAGHVDAPVTDKTGGTSQGDPAAGGNDMGFKDPGSVKHDLPPITKKDQAGAYILTVVVLLGLFVGITFVLVDELDDRTFPERWSAMRSSLASGNMKFAMASAAAAAAGVLTKKKDSAKKPEGGGAEAKDGQGGALSENQANIWNSAMSLDAQEKRASRPSIMESSSRAVRFGSDGPGGSQSASTEDTSSPYPDPQQRRRVSGDPELGLPSPEIGLAQGPDSQQLPPGTGFRQSASQQPENGPEPGHSGRNVLHKTKSSSGWPTGRPGSMAT